MSFIAKTKYDGGTPLGTALEAKILRPMLLEPAQRGTLRKPLLVIVVTDGAPSGERGDKREYFRPVSG